MGKYSTSEVAGIIGIHPNTVRLYEASGLIPIARREKNGYRVFTDFHVEQLKLARAALRVEVLQNGLRKKAVAIIKTSASGDFDEAIRMTENYLQLVSKEKVNAESASSIAASLLAQKDDPDELDSLCLLQKECAGYLGVTTDCLRNWEQNGLLNVKRKQNGYRIYTGEDIRRLIIIRSLRCANYSLSAILRMLLSLSRDPQANPAAALDTPLEDEDVISVCDRLLTSLSAAERNANFVLRQLAEFKQKF